MNHLLCFQGDWAMDPTLELTPLSGHSWPWMPASWTRCSPRRSWGPRDHGGTPMMSSDLGRSSWVVGQAWKHKFAIDIIDLSCVLAILPCSGDMFLAFLFADDMSETYTRIWRWVVLNHPKAMVGKHLNKGTEFGHVNRQGYKVLTHTHTIPYIR